MKPIEIPLQRSEGNVPIFDYLSINDSGEVAFVAKWTDGQGLHHEGVYTSKRVVAEAGDQIGDRTLVTFSNVAINNAGDVAYTAQYHPPGASKTGTTLDGTGNFINGTLIQGDDNGFSSNRNLHIGGIVQGTDGEFYIYRGDGSFTNDGNNWTPPKGPIPEGLEQRNSAAKVLNVARDFPTPWPLGHSACGPLLGSSIINNLRPGQELLLNVMGEPTMTQVGAPGENLTIWTTAGIVVGQDRSTAARYGEVVVWIGKDLVMLNAYPIPGQNRRDPQMNRSGQIAFTAQPLPSDKRRFGAIVATPIQDQGCSAPATLANDCPTLPRPGDVVLYRPKGDLYYKHAAIIAKDGVAVMPDGTAQVTSVISKWGDWGIYQSDPDDTDYGNEWTVWHKKEDSSNHKLTFRNGELFTNKGTLIRVIQPDVTELISWDEANKRIEKKCAGRTLHITQDPPEYHSKYSEPEYWDAYDCKGFVFAPGLARIGEDDPNYPLKDQVDRILHDNGYCQVPAQHTGGHPCLPQPK